jgi:hypothetical protein
MKNSNMNVGISQKQENRFSFVEHWVQQQIEILFHSGENGLLKLWDAAMEDLT